jgi:hypothetical protein
MHGSSKPFKCPHCEYASTREGTLKMHIRRKHASKFQKTKVDHAAAVAPRTVLLNAALKGDIRFRDAAALFGYVKTCETGRAGEKELLLEDNKPFSTLVLGEMDFSFAAALTDRRFNYGNPLGPGLCATSFIRSAEYAATRVARKVRQTVRLLRKRGATVLHGVDATDILKTLELAYAAASPTGSSRRGKKRRRVSEDEDAGHGAGAVGLPPSKGASSSACSNRSSTVDPRNESSGRALSTTLSRRSFARIVFCFPRATTVTGVRLENAALLRGFFTSAKSVLERGGLIAVLLHVCVVDGVPDDQYKTWGVDELAFATGFERIAALPLRRRGDTGRGEDFPGYQPRARDGRPFAPDAAFFHVLRRKDGQGAKGINQR